MQKASLACYRAILRSRPIIISGLIDLRGINGSPPEWVLYCVNHPCLPQMGKWRVYVLFLLDWMARGTFLCFLFCNYVVYLHSPGHLHLRKPECY